MFTEKEKVLEQYQNSNNLSARIALHERFSTRKGVFHGWLFDHIQAPKNANVLELGTGSAKLWQVNRERIPKDWVITLSDLSEGMLDDARKNVADIPASFSFQIIDAQAIPFEENTLYVHVSNIHRRTLRGRLEPSSFRLHH
jgi:ubiquinone/menaquinone biosynthesis C-methylase UbiE